MDRKRKSGFPLGEFFRLIGYPFYLILISALPSIIIFSLNAVAGTTKFIKLRFRAINKKVSKTRKLVKRSIKNQQQSFISLKQKTFARIGIISRLIKLPAIRIRSKLMILLVPLILLILLVPLILNVFRDLPNPQNLRSKQPKLTTHILDRGGSELYKIYRDENRSLVAVDELPTYLIDATVAIEDKDFWNHPGFSITGIARAIFRNVSSFIFHRTLSAPMQGGSTITQQLVKNTLLTPEKTLRRKFREIILAFWIERTFTKKEILQMYLNEVSYGGTAYGIQEAAQQYFGKNATDLSLAEAALMAGLPAAPTTYSPLGTNPEKSRQRQMDVLRRMIEDKYISPEQSEKTLKEELLFTDGSSNIKAPHFVMYIRNLLVEKFGEEIVDHGGLIVTTSLDLPTQEFVQQTVSSEVENLSRLHVTNGAAMVTSPSTGDILAMVGSKDYFDFQHDGQVNVTLRPRQPGSSIKPVMYSAALQKGFTPASIILDAPISFQNPGAKPYSPVNYDGKFHGPIPLRIALGSSYNVPAVKTLATIGVDSMIDQGEKMGIKTWGDRSRFGLSLTLGGGEVTMIDMMEAYGTLANYGMHMPLNPFLKIENSKGEVVYQKIPEGSRAMPSIVAYQLTDILSDPLARAPAFGTHSVLNIPGSKVAVKTGTTNSLRDNWTFGYTTDLAVGAWVGNNDNSPMSYIASGITGASPIWANIIKGLLTGREESHIFPKPTDLITVKICTLTGQLACDGCPSKEEIFLPGTEPKQACRRETIEEIKKKQEENKIDRDKILDGANSQRR